MVETKYGKISGIELEGYTVYKGIPYARAPIGELRFKRPRKPERWEDVYIADHFQPKCMQAGRQIGRVGSSGSSWVPHLHFHVMLGGIEGPGVPVRFENLTTILGEPCMLEDTVNLVRAEGILP